MPDVYCILIQLAPVKYELGKDLASYRLPMTFMIIVSDKAGGEEANAQSLIRGR